MIAQRVRLVWPPALLWIILWTGLAAGSHADSPATAIYNQPNLRGTGPGTIRDDEGLPGVLYVNVEATGLNTGLNWQDAFTDLQRALAVAGTNAIWVARGVYRPAPAGASATNLFAIRSGAALYGGFLSGMSARSQRDPYAHPTVLSGDLNGNDTPNFGNRGDNVAKVVDVRGANGLIFDGFIVRGGFGSGSGAGMAVRMSSPFLVKGCTFTDNQVLAPGVGGGMWCDVGSTGTVANCIINGNYSGFRAGGIGVDGFAAPHANVSLVNCTVSGNTAVDEGDGVYARANPISVLTLRNCIIWGNDALNPIQDNSPAGVQNIRSRGDNANAIVYVSYTDYNPVLSSGDIVQQGGEIAVDPLFADADAGDFHLKSEEGRWTPTGIVRDVETSPCVDAGDPNDACGDEPQRDPCRIDMGAYGGTRQAAGSEGLVPPPGIFLFVE